jgi:hypothetical protein
MLRLEHLLASVQGRLHGGTSLSKLLLDLASIELVQPNRSMLGNNHVAWLLSKGLRDVVERHLATELGHLLETCWHRTGLLQALDLYLAAAWLLRKVASLNPHLVNIISA